MCSFMEYLGWFQMSPKEQWEIGLKLAGSVGAIMVFWWTVRQWFQSKKMELEIVLLENLSSLYAHFIRLQNDTPKEEQPPGINIEEKAVELAKLIKRISSEDLSLRELRRENKIQLSFARFVDLSQRLIYDKHSRKH